MSHRLAQQVRLPGVMDVDVPAVGVDLAAVIAARFEAMEPQHPAEDQVPFRLAVRTAAWNARFAALTKL